MARPDYIPVNTLPLHSFTLPHGRAYVHDSQASTAGMGTRAIAGPYDSQTTAGVYGAHLPVEPYYTTTKQLVDLNDSTSPGSVTEPTSHSQSTTPATRSTSARTNRKRQKKRPAQLAKKTKTKQIKTDLSSSDSDLDSSPASKVDTPMTTPNTSAASTAEAAPRGGKKDPALDPINQRIYQLVVHYGFAWSQVVFILRNDPLCAKPNATQASVYGRFVRNAADIAKLEHRQGFRLQDYMYRFGRDKDGKAIVRRAPAAESRVLEIGEVAEDEEDGVLVREWEKMRLAVAREMTRATGRMWSGDECAARYSAITER